MFFPSVHKTKMLGFRLQQWRPKHFLDSASGGETSSRDTAQASWSLRAHQSTTLGFTRSCLLNLKSRKFREGFTGVHLLCSIMLYSSKWQRRRGRSFRKLCNVFGKKKKKRRTKGEKEKKGGDLLSTHHKAMHVWGQKLKRIQQHENQKQP